MPLIDHANVVGEVSRDGNAIRKTIVSGDNGGDFVHLQDVITTGRIVVPPHSHTHEETITVVEGELTITVGNERFVATSGQTVLIPNGAVHFGGCPAGTRLIERPSTYGGCQGSAW